MQAPRGSDDPLARTPDSASASGAQNQPAPGGAQKKEAKAGSQNDRAAQTKRILGLLPNFRSVSTDDILPPQTAKEKFLTATDDSFDYSSIFIPVALAGYGYLRNATPEFGTGPGAYGQYLWHSALDQTTENYLVEFVVPSLAHQDNRYYTLGRGGLFKRTGYALSRAVVTRSDTSHRQFNVSEILGAGASAALSTTYYPASQRTFGNVGSTWGVDVGIDAASYVVKEFWPDINRKWMHRVNSPHPVQ
ncbi:hypothetical protein DYQ86_08065 [Acidobacteria bacterium AB60]|nr:hypothetical protein DYQ86_08065 [Acidobacteria bacterium AB60]